MTREELRDYVEEQRSLNMIPYHVYSTLIDGIDTLEQEPDIDIKVGDEVIVEGINGVVVREPYPIGSDNEMFVLVWYGQSMSSNSIKNVVPTGRHFPQITEVVELLTVQTAFDTLLSWQTSIEAESGDGE